MSPERDWYARRWEARRALKNPPSWVCGPRGHRWVDVNELPDPEMLVCYRCGYVRSNTKPLGAPR